MTNSEALKVAIDESGISITFIAKTLKCSRNRVYSIIKGAECTASEIVELSQILHLSKPQRDLIFLSNCVNQIHT